MALLLPREYKVQYPNTVMLNSNLLILPQGITKKRGNRWKKTGWCKLMKDVSFHIKLFVKVGLAVVGNGIPTALHEFELEVVIADFLTIYFSVYCKCNQILCFIKWSNFKWALVTNKIKYIKNEILW